MKNLDTVDIAKKNAKDKKLIVFLKIQSYADADGLGISFSILNKDEWFQALFEENEEDNNFLNLILQMDIVVVQWYLNFGIYLKKK